MLITMSSKKYISLGGNCAIAYHIKKLTKQPTYPFDWCQITLLQLKEVLEEDFRNFDKVRLVKFSEKHPPDTDLQSSDGSWILKNSFQVKFAHQVLDRLQLPLFIERLQVRINRFKDLRSGNEELRFLRLETSRWRPIFDKYLKKILEILSERYEDFRMVLWVQKDSKVLVENKFLEIRYFEEFSEDWRYMFLEEDLPNIVKRI